MQAADPEPDRPATSTEVPASEASNSRAVADGSARRWWVTMAAGVLAGLAAWLGGEACLHLFQPPRHTVNSRGLALNITIHREEAAAEAKNAGLAFVFLGAAVGLGFGAAGGLVRRSGRSAVLAGLLGLTLGAAAGAGTSLALLPRYNAYRAERPDDALQDLTYPLFIHVCIWSSIGAIGGLAYGLGLGAWREVPAIVVGALAGAALGAIAYELIGAVGFPKAETARFVSTTWETRLFARLAVTVLAAAGAAQAAAEPRKRTVPKAS